MRITHISIVHMPFDTRIFAKQCRTLAAAGYDVHLVIGGVPDGDIDGVHLHAISRDPERPPARRQLSRLVRAAMWAFRLRPSTFVLHDPHLIPLGLLLKLGGSRVVYDVHEDFPGHARTKLAGRPVRRFFKTRMWGALEWAATRRLDHFVCAGPDIAARFPRSRTTVVHNFPLYARFARGSTNGVFRPYAERPNTVVFHGLMAKFRDPTNLLNAIQLLPVELDCRLRLIGSFREPELAHKAARAERVDVVPWQPFEGIVRELFAARAGLALFYDQPNHIEMATRSNKLFEYMAAGLPVIASDLPAWRKIVLGTGCGLVADPYDPEAIAAAIEHLLTNPNEAEAMGERGQAAVRERFNWEREAPLLVSLYRDLQKAERISLRR
jgi:glycosyltransferase involved in cell wall biosynthesis